VQISAEMWETDKNGNLYFEVFLNRFVEPVIDRWKQLGVTHSLSIIFFSRTYYYGKSNFFSADISEESSLKSTKCLVSVDENLSYQDFYKIVLDNCTYTDKTLFIRSMKKEFWDFPRILNWRMNKEKLKQLYNNNRDVSSSSSPEDYYAVPSGSSGGNVLEAINTTLNVLSKHFMDRDLERTGNSIVMISAGVGFFEVQSKLARITQQRMMDSGNYSLIYI
jgi:hypothetical protein